MASAAQKTFHVRPSNDGATLATALRKMLCEGTSWGEIKRLIVTRHIHINGNLCVDEGRKLKAGDVVHVFEHSRAPLPSAADVVIRHIDAHLVVIEKPAGVNTLRHREEADLPQKRKDLAPTLEEMVQRVVAERFRSGGVRAEAPPAAAAPSRPAGQAPPPHPLFGHRVGPRKSSPPPAMPGKGGPRGPGKPAPRGGPLVIPEVRPVHRLDRDTSGLMLFALSPQAEQALERDFARHAVQRIYLAVVHGRWDAARTIESHLVRDRGDGLRGSGPAGAADAQRALTHVRPVETFGTPPDDYSIVECELETGRTHQIRIHLSEAGHPLAGEKTYTHAIGEPPRPDASGCPRHALHSARLRFTHPITGADLRFESPWPRELAGWLKKVRG